MNKHAKRLRQELETLGFQRDHDHPSKKARVYRHPNQPDQVIKVFDAMNDNSITAASRKANKIADTGWSGPRQPATIKERARVTRRRRTAYERKEQAERDARAAAAEREYERQQRARRAALRQREIRDLMQPGFGR